MRRIVFPVVILLMIVAFCMVGCAGKAEQPKTKEPAKETKETASTVTEVVETSYGVGSQAYSFSVGIAEAVKKVAGITTRVMPSGTDIGRILPVRAGEADFSIFTGATGWFISRGAADFATEEWGPQRLRMVWRGGNLFVGYYTQGDSKYQSFKDLKGCRAAQIPGSPTNNYLVLGGLAFGGFTADDVKLISFPSHSAAGKGVIEGAIDFYEFGTTGDRPTELASSPRGIRWLQMDFNDEEAWNRFFKWCPWVAKGLADRGPGISKENPLQCLTYPYNIWCYDHTDEEKVYQYVKAMWGGYELYKDAHPELAGWTHEAALDTTGCYYPYHPGAIRFFKEVGVWTDKHDAWQNEQLKKEEARLSLWEEAKKEAQQKGMTIGSDQWKDFWWKKLDEKGLLQ